MFVDRDKLAKAGLLQKGLVGYRVTAKGLDLLAEWRKNPYDASKFWYAPLEVRELLTVELQNLGMTMSQVRSYLARYREPSDGPQMSAG